MFFASMSVPVIVLLITIIAAAYNIYEIRKAELSMAKMKKLLDEMIGGYEK
ncbi:MAG: hypothetical protein ACRDBQ_15090 [Shewanella sp.]